MRGMVQRRYGADSAVSDLSAAEVSSSLKVFEKLSWAFRFMQG